MSRPVSAPRMRPPSAGKNGTQKNGQVSYEDMLVAQYLEELQKAPLRYSLTGTSPYSQRLANTHVVPFTQGFSQTHNYERKPRPFSAVNPHRPQSGKQRPDSKYGEGGGWDSHRSHDRRKKRPVSAPVYKTRPLSAATYSSAGSRPWSGKSAGSRRVKALYKRQPHTVVVTAYKNGSRDTFARVVAPNLKMLLEICTEKLELGNAARRVFLGNGKEVFMAREIPRDSDIYISMGEPYKNPYQSVKSHQVQQQSIAWTMHGLIWTSDTKKKPAKTKLSKRFQSLIETSRRRVLVFKNSSGNDGIEIVADPERFEEFLQACTAKLSLTSYARVLFDWEGTPITDLKEAPMLDQCLQTWSTPVLGPLWVSKGEGFSPSGVNDFLQSMITYTKAKLSEAKEYLQELRKAKENNKDDVNIAAILSMGDTEIDEALEIVDKDIEDFTNALNRLKGQMRKLQGEVQQEEAEKSNYKLSHIEQIDTEHRLVGSKGLRMKVYENGTYDDPVILYFNLTQAMRGIGHDQKKLMERLLDQCGNSHYLNNPKTNTALKPVAQKLYDKFGKEVKHVYNIEYDQELWLSFGEPWKNPFTFVVTAIYDKARGYEIQGTRRVAREQLMIEDVKGKDSWAQWESFGQWPDEQDVRVFEAGNPMDMGELDHVQGLLEMGELPLHSSFLRHKESPELMLFGDIAMDVKKARGSNDIWPGDAQTWLITDDGYIRSKAFPRLVLSVSDSGVSCNLTHPLKGVQDTRVEGFLVWLTRKEEHAANQQWVFTTEGQICPKSHPEMALTYTGMRFGDEENAVTNESESALKGIRPYLAVCEKLEGKDEKCQRWAIKQERMDNFGQWKHTEVANSEWNKRALSWPVNENGEINEKFDWPMEGYLMPYAPSLKAEKKSSNSHVAPLRLTVLKNGVRDTTKATQVVGPDLSNMKKDNKVKGKTKGKKKEVPQDDEGIQDDMNVLKLEFTLFLERATGMLDLPFAARRLFDAEGKEHFTLHNLTRDQLVYVSCGEPWTDPNLSKAEQQRRYLLANLASDVGQMRQFMALRNPQTQQHGHLPAIDRMKGRNTTGPSFPDAGGARMKLPQVNGKSKPRGKLKTDHSLPKVNQGSTMSLIGSRSQFAQRSKPRSLGSKASPEAAASSMAQNECQSNEVAADAAAASEDIIGTTEGTDDANGAYGEDHGATYDLHGEASIENNATFDGHGASYNAQETAAETGAQDGNDDEEAAINIRGYGDDEVGDTDRGDDNEEADGNADPSVEDGPISTEQQEYNKTYEYQADAPVNSEQQEYNPTYGYQPESQVQVPVDAESEERGENVREGPNQDIVEGSRDNMEKENQSFGDQNDNTEADTADQNNFSANDQNASEHAEDGGVSFPVADEEQNGDENNDEHSAPPYGGVTFPVPDEGVTYENSQNTGDSPEHNRESYVAETSDHFVDTANHGENGGYSGVGGDLNDHVNGDIGGRDDDNLRYGVPNDDAMYGNQGGTNDDQGYGEDEAEEQSHLNETDYNRSDGHGDQANYQNNEEVGGSQWGDYREDENRDRQNVVDDSGYDFDLAEDGNANDGAETENGVMSGNSGQEAANQNAESGEQGVGSEANSNTKTKTGQISDDEEVEVM